MKPNQILLVSAALAFGIYGCSDEGGGNNPGGSGGAGGAGGDPIMSQGGSGGAGGVAGTAGGGGISGTGGGFDAGMPDGGMPDDAGMQGDSGAPSARCDLSGGTEPLEPLSDDVALPIVFVHGYAGSAQQFQSQAQRYVANGYPADRLFAYDHDGEGSDTAGYADGVDELIDEVLSQFDQFDQVYLMGHSRGTLTSSDYLGDSARAAKVAKYVSLDGWPCLGISVECLALGQADYEGQLHVEVATSPESFADQYEFFIGEAPEVVDIQPQASPIRISGRAVDFPANTGKDGTTLRIWEVDSETGQRVKDAPEATFEIGPDGSWGPAEGLCPKKHYEMELAGLGSGATQHFYPQPFLRDSQFVRLLSGPPDSESRQNTNSGPGHSALITMRMREWTQDDVLRIGVQSESGNQEPENVITSDVADGNIALYLHDDAASPQETTLDLLPWFPDQSFQSGVDIYLPAADPPDGTITLENLPRGDESLPQVLNVPNWPSDNHSITVYFRDYPQDLE